MLGTRDQAIEAAERDFPRFRDAALMSGEEYGFHPEDSRETVSLAEPVFVYHLDADAAKDLEDDFSNFSQILQPAGEWMFPVQVNGQYRTIFALRPRGDGWRGVYLGNSQLALLLQELRSVWPGTGEDRFMLISCVDPRGFFFVALDAPEPNLTPLTRMQATSGRKLDLPENLDEVFPIETTMQFLRDLWAESEGEVPDDG